MQAVECWAVAFGDSCSDEQRCLLAGYANGDLRLFDLRTNSLRWQARMHDSWKAEYKYCTHPIQLQSVRASSGLIWHLSVLAVLRGCCLCMQGKVPKGVCSVHFDRADIAMNKFHAAGLEGQQHVFDARTQHPTQACRHCPLQACGQHGLPSVKAVKSAAGVAGVCKGLCQGGPGGHAVALRSAAAEQGPVGRHDRQRQPAPLQVPLPRPEVGVFGSFCTSGERNSAARKGRFCMLSKGIVLCRAGA